MPRRGPSIDARHPPAPTAGPPPTASPAAVRPVRARWRDPRLVVGVAVVALCTLLGARLLAGADDTVGVWATRGALSEGEEVGVADLVSRQVRFEDQEAADRYLPADAALPEGATVHRSVGAGELLPRAVVGPAGRQRLTEVPLSVGTDAVPATVRVGATVDVWVTPDGEADATTGTAGRPPRSTLVFDDVAVVSVPRTSTALGPTATRQVIVGVGEAQRKRLPVSIAALSRGDVVLTVQR
jgi:hypothetical protein